jgi:hypothetical protein
MTLKSWRPTADFDMVSAAAKMMSEFSDGWKPAIEIPSRWRMLSGYAHGMRWAAAPDAEQSHVEAAVSQAISFVPLGLSRRGRAGVADVRR